VLGDHSLDGEHARAAVATGVGGAAHLREASGTRGDRLGHQTVTHDRALADDHGTPLIRRAWSARSTGLLR